MMTQDQQMEAPVELHFSEHSIKRLSERFPLLFRKFGMGITKYLQPSTRFTRDETFQLALRQRYPDRFNPTPQPFIVYTYLDVLVLTRGGVVITVYNRTSGFKIFEQQKSDYLRSQN